MKGVKTGGESLKPLIAITPSLNEKGCITVNQDYLNAVFRAGGLPMLLPVMTEEALLRAALDRADGLLLTGGADVDPSRYGEETLPCCGDTEPRRDAMEFPLCRLAVERDLPVLAICRGHQVLSTSLGGTMYQDIETQFSPQLKHPQYTTPRDKVHPVRVEKDSLLYRVTGLDSFSVNSRHHQAVKTPGAGLRVTAWAPDGLIEGVELPGKRFVLGVQWHPESLSDRYAEAQALFNAFAEACTV